jgi:glycosyltransferase involved in cell wall biosynthesis
MNSINCASLDDIYVSVYCATYNHETYIAGALNSFLEQETDFKFEIIVHDDASTDGTADIIRQYAERHPEIIRHIIQKENQYSRGIKIFPTYIAPLLRGKYVAVCEGDDYWCDENKLQKQVNWLDTHPNCSACVHSTLAVDMFSLKDRIIGGTSGYLSLESISMGGGSEFHTSSVMYRRKYATNRPGFLTAIPGVGDYPLAIYLRLSGEIYRLEDTMSIYRSRVPNSWSARMRSSLNKLESVLLAEKEMLQAADAYSNYVYTSVFTRAALYKEYQLAKWFGLNALIRQPKFREFYRNERLSRRIFMCVPYSAKFRRLLVKYLL